MAGTDHARRRRHWGIENSCHYIIHWCFNEDRSRISKGHGPERFWLSISALEVGKGLMPPPALMSRAPFRGIPFLAGGFSPRQIGQGVGYRVLLAARCRGLNPPASKATALKGARKILAIDKRTGSGKRSHASASSNVPSPLQGASLSCRGV
jgi:hypothetical protein